MPKFSNWVGYGSLAELGPESELKVITSLFLFDHIQNKHEIKFPMHCYELVKE